MKLHKTLLAIAISALFAPTSLAQTKALNYELAQINGPLKATGVTAPTGPWARGITGKGVTIAVIDNGFDLTHADFAGKIIASRNFYPGMPNITWGVHGTMMAGIAAGARNGLGTIGVAPNASLILAQVGAGGDTGGIDTTAVYRAIDWASGLGATAINMSFGYSYDNTFRAGVKYLAPGMYKSPAAYGTMYGLKLTDLNAYAVGTNRGSILVAAAGNQGLPYAAFPGHFATQVNSSGALVLNGQMIIVGATNSSGTMPANFSNKAGTLCTTVATNGSGCNQLFLVKDFYVMAPGMQVYGSYPNQGAADTILGDTGTNGAIANNGTSPAAAYVSGGIALLKQKWPQLRANQTVALILNTATPIAGCSSDRCGKGLVNLNAATTPMGELTVADLTILNGSGVVNGKPLVSTVVVTSGAIKLGGTSSILDNIQAVDTIGRNYTVNLSNAVGTYNSMSYQFGNPYMAFSPRNYKQVVAPVGNDGMLTVMGGDGGSAMQYEWQHNKDTRLSLESGSLTEYNGLLGTTGSGAMALGSSSTALMGVGVKHNIFGNTNLIGNYNMGVTSTSNVAGSMVALDSTVVSDSWKLGIVQENIFFNSQRTKDSFTMSLSQPVTVIRGYANISGVTDYTYSDNGDGTSDANPVMSSQRVSLAPRTKQTDLVFGYQLASKGNRKWSYTTIGINVVQQFKVGGRIGSKARSGSIMLRSFF